MPLMYYQMPRGCEMLPKSEHNMISHQDNVAPLLLRVLFVPFCCLLEGNPQIIKQPILQIREQF